VECVLHSIDCGKVLRLLISKDLVAEKIEFIE